MFKKRSYLQKNKLLLPLAVVALLMGWFLAFGKTFEAVRLNSELNSRMVTNNDISFNPEYTERKLAALENILKSYQVPEETWSNELWMKGSFAAAKQNVAIDYTVSKPALAADSTTVGISQTLYCYGDFVQLVKVMDTLERIAGIGKLSALQIKGPKEAVTGDRKRQCEMRMDFKAIDLIKK